MYALAAWCGTPAIGIGSSGALVAARQREVERLRGDDRVVEEELVEVAHAKEEERVRVRRLRGEELPHHRRRLGLRRGLRRGLRSWHQKNGLPSAMSSVFKSMMNKPSAAPSTTAMAPSGGRNIDDRGTTAVVVPVRLIPSG